MVYLGIDCGATSLRVGIVDHEGKLSHQIKVSSPLKNNPQSFAKIVKGLIGGEFEAIGIGVPGPLDLEKGLILPSSNLGNKELLAIVTPFESLFSTKVFLDRDTNVALLGEQWVGAAKDCKNVIMLTLGTGVGGAVMVDGEVDRGEGGKAGEIGHMIIEMNVARGSASSVSLLAVIPHCGLGHQGCLEALINSTDDLDKIGEYLGVGLANIVNIFNPEKIIIGGGKLAIGDFLPKAVEVMRDTGMKPAVDEVVVEYGNLKEWAGVIGAAKLAIDKK